MAGLKETTAKLARYKRQWENVYAATAAARAARPDAAGSGRLTETTDFGSNPGNLRMLTYLPENLPADAPMVVVLHGCTQTAEGYDHGAGWSTLADRHGFAVLFPEQGRANNPNLCFNWFAPGDIARGKGEALSIRLMVERAVADHDLDPRRVFVTGLSAGGAMAAVMLATYPEVFSGGAIIAGLPYGAAGSVQEALDAMYQGKDFSAREWGDLVRGASRHNGPWPRISIWHGSADSTVRPSNADALVMQWTHLHGLGSKPSAEDMVDGYPRRIWRDDSGETVVESYTITGMAHGTPIAAGGPDAAGVAGAFILESGISSSYRIAQFWGLTADASQAGEPAHGHAPERTRDAAAKPMPKTDVQVRSAPRITPIAGRAKPREQARPNAASAFDPQTVITKALKKAGLLKG